MSHHKTLADLRTYVRDQLDESTASFWTDDQIDRVINRARDRVWNEVRKLDEDYFMVTRTASDGALTILGESFTASTLAVAVSGTSITLPHDFAEMKLILVTTSGYEWVRFEHRDLTHPDMRDALDMTDTTTPGTFYFDIIAERTLRYAPKSDTALNLSITYVQRFDELEDDTDELTMPYPFYLAVEEYAISSAMLQDRNPDAATHEARAKQIILDAFGADSRQRQDTVNVIGYLEGM